MNMRHFAFIAGALGLAVTASAAIAQSRPVVLVELFTSQGCSSCPPADAFMESLVKDPNVIALALHVDYWDYIGWKDEFAHAAFTDRQKEYARAIGSRTIYTPQFVINGLDRIEGANPEAVTSLIRMHLEKAVPLSLSLQRDGDRLLINASKPAGGATMMIVNLVRYRPEESVMIERGENAGHTFTYHNIVTELSALGEWSGAEPFAFEATVTGPEEVAVFVQRRDDLAVLAAARLD